MGDDDRRLGSAERTRMHDDLHQHPLVASQAAIDPADGLPRVLAPTSMEDSKAPPLTPETFVCGEDAPHYVLALGVQHRALRAALAISPESVFWVEGQAWAEIPEHQLPEGLPKGSGAWVHDEQDVFRPGVGVVRARQVEPLRPTCQHYRRVLTDFEGQSHIKAMERVCMAQRTDGGEYVSLKDTRVHACELRSPRDFVSEERLRAFDDKRIEESKASQEPDWDPDKDLGILSSKH